jgi:hypothetical protein
MDSTLLTFIAVGVLIVCFFSYPDIFMPKSLENMNTEEIITDFEKLIQLENNKTNNKESFASLNNTKFADGTTSWGTYTQGPFYELKTHPRDPVFYVKPIYRKPYRFPYKYMSSYPVNHMSPFNV